MKPRARCLLLLAIFLCTGLSRLPSSLAALPDFDCLKILSLSHSLEQGPRIDPDPFFPEYESLWYQMRLDISVERPAEWHSSLLDLPYQAISYVGAAILELYQREGVEREKLSSMRVRVEIYPTWVTPESELSEVPSRISYYVPAFLLEKGAKGQIGPKEMLDRGRAHFRAMMRKRESR